MEEEQGYTDLPETGPEVVIPDPELEEQSPKHLFYGILIVLAIFGVIFGIGYLKDTKFIPTSNPVTGATTARPSEDCYVYNNHEFCKVDDIWYTDFIQGDTIFTGVGFHYDPNNVRDIEIEGKVSESFLKSDVYYVTFDPTKEELGYTALASAELQLSMGRAMQLPLKAACTKDHPDCDKVPKITCDNTDKPVFFINEQPETEILFDDNCITISGDGEELVRAVDRLLYFWYGIMV